MSSLGIKPVHFNNVKINSNFWSPRIETTRAVTARVCIDECERTNRIDNFRRAAGLKDGPHEGKYYNDSDVYKVLEGIAYMLMDGADPELEAAADLIIDAICAAQQPDGYLYTFYTLTYPERRWTDMSFHESYCLGHMTEAAVAYAQATGKTKWLRAAERAIRQMMSVNHEGGQHWVTGHQELELALIKLYRYTQKEEYLTYAEWLINERGHGYLKTPYFPDREFYTSEYCQDDLPARDLSRVTGHAVRAMYYYSGMADIAAIRGDKGMDEALVRLWNSVVPANYYLTGGIGQSASNEGFTRDFSLPNLTAYCETCASIGMALWNQRMNYLHGEARYADIVERELYNGALAGISLKGDTFFYDNPLSSVGTHHRRKWFGCSCCPTNLIRFLPSVGGYAYALSGGTAYINQFLQSTAYLPCEGGEAVLDVKTDYPWSGRVEISVIKRGGLQNLLLRKPDWCEKWTLRAGCEDIYRKPENGYLAAEAKEGETLVYEMEMPVRRVYADERVAEDKGRVAVMRGPIVYCAEETDNPGFISEYFHADLTLPREAPLHARAVPELLGGVTVVEGGGLRLVPYYAWDNREPGAMTVWIKE